MKFYLAGNLRVFGADSTVEPIPLDKKNDIGVLISFADPRAVRVARAEKDKTKNRRKKNGKK